MSLGRAQTHKQLQVAMVKVKEAKKDVLLVITGKMWRHDFRRYEKRIAGLGLEDSVKGMRIDDISVLDLAEIVALSFQEPVVQVDAADG